ncbi:MAG: hypothetical protein RLZ91_1086, partial [Bacteroidota bacterium]
MFLNKISGILLLSLFSFHSLFSQAPLSIRGKLLDKQAPVEFANVLLYAQADTVKLLKHAVSDSLGQFNLAAPAGSYFVKFQIIGYEPKRIAFQVKESVDLGAITLQEDNRLLASVEVVSQKELVQKTTQGFIIKAKDNLTQAGGSATDLLKSVPTVVVDADGAITVRGKGPLILINGRTSGISSTDLIPASSVESVEIINNPSAQYDADSEGGIINIKLKKVTTGGTNAMASIGGGMGAKARGSSAFSINHQAGKWNIGLNYDMKYSERTRQANTTRTSFDQPLNYLLTQGRQDNRTEQTQNLKLNVDYAASDRDVFNLELIGNFEGQDNDETLISRFAS